MVPIVIRSIGVLDPDGELPSSAIMESDVVLDLHRVMGGRSFKAVEVIRGDDSDTVLCESSAAGSGASLIEPVDS